MRQRQKNEDAKKGIEDYIIEDWEKLNHEGRLKDLKVSVLDLYLREKQITFPKGMLKKGKIDLVTADIARSVIRKLTTTEIEHTDGSDDSDDEEDHDDEHFIIEEIGDSDDDSSSGDDCVFMQVTETVGVAVMEAVARMKIGISIHCLIQLDLVKLLQHGKEKLMYKYYNFS